MNDPRHRLSRSVEDYLKAIFGLTENGDAAATSSLADQLAVQPSSVTGMVKRLAEMGLLEHVPYRGVRLTPAGVTEALRVVRRHRILETYLTERLGYTWDDVHDEAERLEHAASETLIEAMARSLGDPSHDPHGAPIPTPDGDLEPRPTRTLADVPPGSMVLVRSVSGQQRETLQILGDRGLRPGARVRVLARDTGGDLRVDVAGVDDPGGSLPAELANQVYVGPLP